MPVYEVIITQVPTRTERENGKLETLIVHPTVIIARNDQAAAMNVSMDMVDKLAKYDRDRLEVHVRPF